MRRKRIAVIAMVAAILAVNAGTVYPVANTQPVSIVHAANAQQMLDKNEIQCMQSYTATETNPEAHDYFCLTNVTLPIEKSDDGDKIIGDIYIGDTWSSTSIIAYPLNDGNDHAIEGINGGLFANNADLTSIRLPSGVAKIPTDTFRNCVNLTSVTSSGAVVIDISAFDGCTGLEYVSAGNVIKINSNAFDGCTNLKALPIKSTTRMIGDYAFRNCGYEGDLAITAADENNITTIGKGAFEGSSITSVSQLGNATLIPDSAFKNCKNLTSVRLPNTVTEIGPNAFAGCENLQTIYIPDSVTKIDPSAFDGVSEIVFECSAGSFAATYALQYDNITLTEDAMTHLDEVADTSYFAYTASATLDASSIHPLINSATGSILDLSTVGENTGEKLETISSIVTNGKKLVVILPNTVSSINEDAINARTAATLTLVANVNSTTYNTIAAYNKRAENDQNMPKLTLITPQSMYALQPDVVDDKSTDNTGATTDDTNDKTQDGASDSGNTSSAPVTYSNQLVAPYNTYTAIQDATQYVHASNCTITGLNPDVQIGDTDSKKLVIPASINDMEVIGIGENAFRGCKWISELELPPTVVSISKNAFLECTSLNKIDIPSDSNLTSIGVSAFSGTNLAKLDSLPASLSTIERDAFSGCKSLITVELPENIQYVGFRAFSACQNLTRINIPDSLAPDENGAAKIMNDVFRYNSLTTIYGKTGSFANTYADTNVIPFVDENLEEEDTDILKFITYSNDLLTNNICIESIHDYTETDADGNITKTIPVPADFVLPDKIDGKPIVKIDSNAIKGVSSLKTLTLPESVTTLNENAFADCESLEYVNIPNAITRIPSGAFQNCKKLQSIKLPAKYTDPADSSKNVSGITDIGDHAFAGCESLKTIENMQVADIQAYTFDGCTNLTLDKINVRYSIGACAFRNCKSIKDLEITTISVTNADRQITWKNLAVDASAFEGCSNLTNIKINNNAHLTSFGNAAFKDCTSLTSIPDITEVANISKNAFNGCTALTKVTIPKSVGYIYESAFDGCSNLTSVVFEKDNDEVNTHSLGYRAFAETGITSFTIPEKVSVISEGLFADCKNLKTITTHNGITKIGRGAFSGCTALESFVMPNAITVVPMSTFANCTSLKTVKLAANTEGIENNAFENCTALSTIELPDTVKYIFGSAFKNSGLTSIKIPTNMTSIRENVFEGCSKLADVTFSENVNAIGTNSFKDCTDLKYVTFSPKLKTLGTAAFEGSGLRRINLSNTRVTEISENAFSNCANLSNVVLNENTTSIAANAFANTALTEFVVPTSVSKIGDKAFADCEHLDSLTIYAGTHTIGADITLNNPNIVIKGNNGSVANMYAIENNIPFESIDVLDPDAEEESDFYYVHKSTYIEIIGCKPELKGDITIPETIDDKPVREIRSAAFANNVNITGVTVPAGVSIGDKAFYNCSELTNVTLTDTRIINESTFANCTKLETINLGTNIQSINKNAFDNCESLQTISAPNTLTTLREGCFKNCKNLETATFEGRIRTVPKNAFYGCEKLKSIEIGSDEVGRPSTIDAAAFIYCKSMTNCGALTSAVTSLGTNAFQGCSSLTDADLSNVTSISPYAFTDCEELTNVQTSDALRVIGANAFQNCSKLTGINIASTTHTIGDYAFDNCNLREVIITNSYATIGKATFANNHNLIRAILPTRVKSIPEEAFLNCEKLSTINPNENGTSTIPDDVTYIRPKAFAGCKNLGNLRIPRGTISIYDKAFDGNNVDENSDSNLVMEVYKNSTAHSYAYTNKIRYRIIDDETGQLTDEEPTYYDTPSATPPTPSQGATPSDPSTGTGTGNTPGSTSDEKLDTPLTEDKAAELVIHDHEQRTGHTVVDGSTTTTVAEDGTLEITFTDDSGNSSTYYVDTTTGGATIHNSGEYVRLPQTGITSRTNFLIALLALAMSGIGAVLMKASGVFRKRRSE